MYFSLRVTRKKRTRRGVAAYFWVRFDVHIEFDTYPTSETMRVLKILIGASIEI